MICRKWLFGGCLCGQFAWGFMPAGLKSCGTQWGLISGPPRYVVPAKNGGGGGNRTRVPMPLGKGFYMLSLSFSALASPGPARQGSVSASPIVSHPATSGKKAGPACKRSSRRSRRQDPWDGLLLCSHCHVIIGTCCLRQVFNEAS